MRKYMLYKEHYVVEWTGMMKCFFGFCFSGVENQTCYLPQKNNIMYIHIFLRRDTQKTLI